MTLFCYQSKRSFYFMSFKSGKVMSFCGGIPDVSGCFLVLVMSD